MNRPPKQKDFVFIMKRIQCFFLFYILTCIAPLPSFALDLQPDAPRLYTVQPGDTLWSIASRYLKKPWEWHALWHANPQIKNPKKLYIGAVLELHANRKHPYFRVLSNGTVKLEPHMRVLPDLDPVPPIPLNIIRPFLNGSMVYDEDDMTDAPYVIGFNGDQMMGGPGDEMYVENLPLPCEIPGGTTVVYAVFRPDKLYFEPLSHRFLGFGSKLIGHANMVKPDNPAKLLLTNITEGVKIKDRVILDTQPEYKLYFEPQTPLFPVKGSIIDVLGNFTRGAIGLVVVLDRGMDAGLRPGDVLSIKTRRTLITDPIYKDTKILMPEERIGELMIFRVFSLTSYALVVSSNRAVHLFDHVANP